MFGRNQLRRQSQMFRLILSITLPRTVSVSALNSHFFLLKKFGHSFEKMKNKITSNLLGVSIFLLLLYKWFMCLSIAFEELIWFIIQIFFWYSWIFRGFVSQKKKIKTTKKLNNNYAWMRISNILALFEMFASDFFFEWIEASI